MQYKVVVTVLAEVDYEVTIDAASEGLAEDAAAAMWREKLPEDFQVEKGYITRVEVEAERLTWECEECGAVISELQWNQSDEMCWACFDDTTANDMRGAAWNIDHADMREAQGIPAEEWQF